MKLNNFSDAQDLKLNSYYGIQVRKCSQIPERIPKLEIRATVEVTDEFRLTFNKWLLDTFGTRPFILVMDNVYHVHPNCYTQIIRELNHAGVRDKK